MSQERFQADILFLSRDAISMSLYVLSDADSSLYSKHILPSCISSSGKDSTLESQLVLRSFFFLGVTKLRVSYPQSTLKSKYAIHLIRLQSLLPGKSPTTSHLRLRCISQHGISHPTPQICIPYYTRILEIDSVQYLRFVRPNIEWVFAFGPPRKPQTKGVGARPRLDWKAL